MSKLVLKTFAIRAKHCKRAADVREQAEKSGFVYEEDQPSFVISLGGDGTFLRTEREFPGIPKLAVRDSLICFKCHNESLDRMLELIGDGRWKLQSASKLRCVVARQGLLATNDVVIRNRDPRHALRFRICVNGDEFRHTFVGDGIVAATPFGSTGYYHSMTRSKFDQDFGVAFNNCVETTEPLRLGDDARVDLLVVRSDAHLSVDNHPELFALSEGDTVSVCKAEQETRLVAHP